MAGLSKEKRGVFVFGLFGLVLGMIMGTAVGMFFVF